MKIKIQQNKERNTIAKQSQLSSLNSSMIKIKKEDSKHTKLSTNITSQSLHINAANKKSLKQKKPDTQIVQKKQKTIRNTELVTSGRSKTLKQKIKNKKSCDFQILKSFQPIEQGSVSYREYCLVQNSFVPIVSKNQHQKLQDIMRSTADTTIQFQDFNRATFRNIFPFKLRDHNQSVSKICEPEQNIFKKSRKVSKRQVEIEASPFYEEVGIQYSQRPQIIEKVVQEQKQVKAVQIDIQTQQFLGPESPVKFLDTIVQKQQEEEESLQNLLLKLQFKHLPNQKVFENLSKNEKQHYSQLLSSLIAKLNCSPRQKEVNPIKTKSMIEDEQVNVVHLEQIKIKYEQLQMQILKRESCQMNWIQKRFNPIEPEGSFDTSMIAVSSFLLNFFCYVELNFLEEFVNNIRKQYGPSFYAQFLRVTRKLRPQNCNSKVLDLSIFQEFCEELNEISNFEKYHLRAIFDYVNDLLDTYRPSYHHKGEPFPWATKIYNSICQYVIDQSSMEIIFIEVKENIEQAVSMLCGLIVDQSLYKNISEVNPLSAKRNQKENLLVQGWLNEQNQENHLIQCESTKVLSELSEEIYNMLLLEIFEEKPFTKYNDK